MNHSTASVRWMIGRDLFRASEIAKLRGLRTTEAYLRKSIADDSTVNLVLEVDGEVLGYIIYQVRNYSVSILEVCVEKDGVGHGRELIESVLGRLSKSRQRATAMVPERDLGLQKFFSRCGFRAVRIIPCDEGNSYLFVHRVPLEEL